MLVAAFAKTDWRICEIFKILCHKMKERHLKLYYLVLINRTGSLSGRISTDWRS